MCGGRERGGAASDTLLLTNDGKHPHKHPPPPKQKNNNPPRTKGSIEGRVAVHHVEDAVGQAKNFTFKCHREGADIYSVNAIAFHPVHGTFVTTGSDGTFNFWDKDSKQRLKALAKCQYGPDPAPIAAGAFNSDGSIFAYAVSYDWSHGFSQHNPATVRHHILLHPTQEAEVKNRARAKR